MEYCAVLLRRADSFYMGILILFYFELGRSEFFLAFDHIKIKK